MTVRADPYASHLPVLRAIGAGIKVRFTLEFGAGKYSTSLFLDRAAFPHMDQLSCYEEDFKWIQRAYKDSQDFGVRLAASQVTPDHPAREAAELVVIEDFDLIFIDNGVIPDHLEHSPERVAVIEAISARQPAAVVVIHDWERMAYQRAAHFEHTWVYWRALPQTAICWNGDRPDVEAALRGLIDEQ